VPPRRSARRAVTTALEIWRRAGRAWASTGRRPVRKSRLPMSRRPRPIPPSSARRSGRSEGQLGHPEEAVATNNSDGDDRPEEDGEDEEGEDLLAPGIAVWLFREGSVNVHVLHPSALQAALQTRRSDSVIRDDYQERRLVQSIDVTSEDGRTIAVASALVAGHFKVRQVRPDQTPATTLAAFPSSTRRKHKALSSGRNWPLIRSTPGFR
jgi:hypothetical protein